MSIDYSENQFEEVRAWTVTVVDEGTMDGSA